MSQIDPNRRFQIALERTCAGWAAAQPAQAAARARCELVPGGVRVPFFGGPHVVSHPSGEVRFEPTGRAAHPSVAIVLMHYLLTADATPPAGEWVAFRDLPDGLFYAQAFAGKAEAVLTKRFGSELEAFRQAASAIGGVPLDLADTSYSFQALPSLPIAVLLWEGDEEFPGRARILFDAHAGHSLPTEDLSGIGDWLAHRLARAVGAPLVGARAGTRPAPTVTPCCSGTLYGCLGEGRHDTCPHRTNLVPIPAVSLLASAYLGIA